MLDTAALSAILDPFGLQVWASDYLPAGTIAYMRGNQCIGCTTLERVRFLGLFGFVEHVAGCTGVVLAAVDYQDLVATLGGETCE